MGQAKQRKLSDPNYGKPAKKIRGLIVSNPTTIRSDGSVMVNSSELDSQELRSSLLYWDKLAFPKNRMIMIGDNDEVKELVNCGIMETPTIDINLNGYASQLITAAQANAIRYYEQKDPGVWSLGGGVNSLVTDEQMARTGTGIELYNALPIPDASVPLVEILDFKSRRIDELMIFRDHMDEVILKIANSEDSADAFKKALQELDMSCANLIKVTREWRFPVKLSNMSASINISLPKSFSSAAAIWKTAEEMALGKTSQVIAATIAGIAANFKLSADFKLQGIKRTTSPYKYIYNATKELKA